MPLSATAVQSAKAKAKSYKLSDSGGLYLEISPKGGKWWRYKYRFDGKEKRISLGTYPDVSLAKARENHSAARKLLADGINPSEDRQNIKASKKLNATNSFEQVARAWITSHMVNKAESHKSKVLRRFELYLFPWIGSKPISSITAPQFLETVKRVESLNIAETAKRTLQTAGQVFRYAVQNGFTERDVTADLKGALAATTKKHMAALTDPKEVSELLRAIDGFKGSFTVLCALKMSPLVFARPGELRTAKWADIDLNTAEWRYVVSKTKTNHLVPLSTQAVAILSSLLPVSGKGVYVFPGGHSSLRPMSEAAVNAALKRLGYNTQTEITGHGFRAMARTLLHEQLNFDPHIIEHQLAHAVPDNLGAAYNRTKFIVQRKEMMQAWADYLDELKTGVKAKPRKKTKKT